MLQPTALLRGARNIRKNLVASAQRTRWAVLQGADSTGWRIRAFAEKPGWPGGEPVEIIRREFVQLSAKTPELGHTKDSKNYRGMASTSGIRRFCVKFAGFDRLAQAFPKLLGGCFGCVFAGFVLVVW